MQTIVVVMAIGFGALAGAALATRRSRRRRRSSALLDVPADLLPAGLKHLAAGMRGTTEPGFRIERGARLNGRPRLGSVLDAR